MLPTNSSEPADSSGSPEVSGSSSSSTSSQASSASESESDFDTDSSEDEEEEEISPEYLDSLLEKARASIAAKLEHDASNQHGDVLEDDVIKLDDQESELKCVLAHSSPLTDSSSSSLFRHLPPLDPGALPPSYITFGKTRYDAPSAIRDLDAERVMQSSSSLSVPTPPEPPPKPKKSLAKEKKAV